MSTSPTDKILFPTRRNLLKGGAFLALTATLGRPARSQGKTLVVANWKGYGSDLAWATETFSKMTGATVVHQYFHNLPALIQLLQTGGVGQVDVALPNLMYIRRAIDGGLVEPIDVGRLANYKHIYQGLRDVPTLSKDGSVYGVPWVWGSNDLFYHSELLPEGVDSWQALWDPKFKSKLAWTDDASAAVLIASMAIKENPEKPDLDKIRAALTELKPNFKVLYGSNDEFTKAFLTKSVSSGQVWSNLGGSLTAQKLPLVQVVATEGSVGWQDNWTIVKDAPNKDLAYQWIDFMIGLEFQKYWASTPDAGSPAPVNEAAVKALDETSIIRVQAKPDRIERLVMQKDMPEEQLKSWFRVWQTVKAS